MSFLDRTLERLGYAKKSASDRPNFGNAYDPGFSSSWLQYLDRSRDSNYNYEVGALELSSLCAAVFNWTGIQLPEAVPTVQKANADGEMEPVPNHPCSELIRRPNPYTTWADDCLAGAISWWLDGNWYMKKVRNDLTKQVMELWYIPHNLIEPRWYGDGGTPEVPANEVNDLNAFLSHYQYTQPGKEPILIPASEIIHIKRGKSLANPRKGIRAFDPVIKEIFGDNKAAAFSANILKNMGMVQVLLAPKDAGMQVNKEQATHIKEQWIINSTGENANKPMVNPIPLDVQQISWSPKDMDLKELRKVPESRVAAVTGIPAAMLQFLVGLEHGTSFAAYKQAREQGYESVIVPIQKAIAEQITWQLLRTEFKGSEKDEFIFDTNSVRVLQEDQDKIVERESIVFKSGGSTLDQYLQAVGKDPVGSPLGDVRMIPTTSQPMGPERLLEQAAEAPQPPPTPTPDTNVPPPAKMVDVDRYLSALEKQAEEFAGR